MDDAELARDAVARGEILPLARILPGVEAAHPGRIIEIELEYERNARIYELEILTPDGRLIEVDVDAVTGIILDVDEEED